MAPTGEEKRGDWTVGEKASIMWSIIDAHPIDWKTTKVPKGRTKNAVTKMLGRERGKVAADIDAFRAENGTTAGTDGTAATPKPSRARGAAKGTPGNVNKASSKTNIKGTPTMPTLTSRKRKLSTKAEMFEEDDAEDEQDDNVENGPIAKKIKIDIKAECDEDDDKDFGDFDSASLAT